MTFTSTTAEEVLRLAKATLESVRELRETQTDNGGDEDIPLVTGQIPSDEILSCLHTHPDIDQNLRKRMVWMDGGDRLMVYIMIFDEDGESRAIRRVPYATVTDAPSATAE